VVLKRAEPNREGRARGRAAASTLDGYIILGKFLVNKTPRKIEADLGLKELVGRRSENLSLP